MLAASQALSKERPNNFYTIKTLNVSNLAVKTGKGSLWLFPTKHDYNFSEVTFTFKFCSLVCCPNMTIGQSLNMS